jgi:hypothetical protein
MPQNLRYFLPRAGIALVGWGAAYWLLTKLSTHVSPAIVYITAIAWALGGVACFGYIRKLLREAALLPDRTANTERNPT